MNIGIIGSSGHYQYALEGLDGDTAVTALAPGFPGEDMRPVLAGLAERNSSPNYYKSYQELLSAETIDVAVVNSRFDKNAEITKQALSCKKHIFTEKPLALTISELETLRKSYEESNMKLATMMGTRGCPWFRTAKRILENEGIGEIRLMNTQKSYRLGSRPSFFKNRETYGGTISWVGIHAIDWLHWLSGKKFKSVYASHSSLQNHGHGALEVSALCLFQMENELLGSVAIDYLRPDSAPTHDDDRVRIVGTKGILEIRDQKVYLLLGQSVSEVGQDPSLNLFSDFLQYIRGQGECLISAEESFYISYASLMARESADVGRALLF